MDLKLIVAMDENRLIGNNNELPWYIPGDLKYFREQTLNSTIIMGRKTFESLGSKPLPHRRNIIMSRDKNFKANGCIVINDIGELDKIQESGFVIGGREIFDLLIPKINTMLITKIYHSFEGDTYFPEIDHDEWELLSSKKGSTERGIDLNYYFDTWQRRIKREV